MKREPTEVFLNQVFPKPTDFKQPTTPEVQQPVRTKNKKKRKKATTKPGELPVGWIDTGDSVG